MDTEKIYHVRWLDFKYLADYGHINLQYLTYEVAAVSEEQAIKKAQVSYMTGEKEKFSEELPFLLKMFSVTPLTKDKG